MATTMYSGDAGAAQALDYTRIIALSGGSPISGSRIDSVVAAALMSTNAYSNTYQVRVRLLDSGGATLAEVTRTDIKFTSSNYGGAIWQFDFGTSVDVNSIASISFFGLNEASKIFVKNTPQTVTIGYTVYTNCSAPSSASVSPTLAETAPTLTWSGAGAGAANSITGYEIQYAESADNSIWGDWTALKTVTTAATSGSTTVDLPATRGYYRKYRIRTQGGAGSSYYSAWKETNGIRYNRLPSAPTSFVASPDVYVSGYISLVYSGASDPDGNPLSHNVQYAMSADGVAWGAWASLANNATTHTPTLGDNAYIKYQARAVDSAGGVSDYLESNVCGKNTAPGDLTINYPQTDKTIHNSRPRFLVTLGSDPEAHMQVITADGYTASRASNLEAGAKVILRRTDGATDGTVSISAKAADVHGLESSAVTRSTTYTAPNYTDTMEKGTTRIKAAHMTELRTMVNTIRQYYGLSAVAWAETITAGVTKSREWKAHVVELQQAISDIVTLVNGWDAVSTVNQIAAFTWISPGVKPSAAVMNQIRQVIAWL